MKQLIARRSNRAFAAHGRSGRSAHWIGQPCPAERLGDYRCVDDGFIHKSDVATDHLLLSTDTGDGRRALGREETAAVIESATALGNLASLVLEHLGAFESRPGRGDELPSVIRRPSARGGFVVRVRGCGPYRMRVKSSLASLGNISATAAG